MTHEERYDKWISDEMNHYNCKQDFIDMLEEVAREQRQMSTAAIQPEMDLAGVSEAWQEIIGQACMEATGEKDAD